MAGELNFLRGGPTEVGPARVVRSRDEAIGREVRESLMRGNRVTITRVEDGIVIEDEEGTTFMVDGAVAEGWKSGGK